MITLITLSRWLAIVVVGNPWNGVETGRQGGSICAFFTVIMSAKIPRT